MQADTNEAGGMTPAPSGDEPPRYRRFLSVRYRTPKMEIQYVNLSRKCLFIGNGKMSRIDGYR
jgi:hypothetical protein